MGENELTTPRPRYIAGRIPYPTPGFLVWLLVIGAFVAVFYGLIVPRVSLGQVQNRIERDIAPGTSPEFIRQWIDSQPDLKYGGGIVDERSREGTDILGYMPNTGPLLDSFQAIRIRFVFHDGRFSRAEFENEHFPFF